MAVKTFQMYTLDHSEGDVKRSLLGGGGGMTQQPQSWKKKKPISERRVEQMRWRESPF